MTVTLLEKTAMDSKEAYLQCLEKLIWASNRLQAEVEPTQLARIADLIVQPMTGVWRFFHTPEHIFEVGGNEDPIEVLAALFHDIVYVQVDRSINFNVSYYITPYTKEVNKQLQIRDASELPKDAIFEMIMTVFGFVPGEVLNPFAGQNEFLSALVAVKSLEKFLQLKQLIEIAACIEATIPFRAAEWGITASQRLHDRLQAINTLFDLSLTDEAIKETVKKSVRIANRDVISFAHQSPAHFLANTWNLLPETNHNLSCCSFYTVREFRFALLKMEGFMNYLNPEVIFRQFEGCPDDRTYQQWENTAKKNLEIGRLYLGCKLAAIALLESLASGLGADVSLATVMGENPNLVSESFRLESFFPTIEKPYQPKTALEAEVLNLLENGRAKSSSNTDLENSPLATFMVKIVGFDEMRYQCDRAKELFRENISADDFIGDFNPIVSEIVVDSIIKLFDSRTGTIERYYTLTSELKSKFQTNLPARPFLSND
ncbi:MAG: hypothetical protein MUE44_24470 [Oscillatoriaceae cyanobacterium Prado104]|jgi:hypothetical protein|nr:hypothetical protein [Oscillatoriaceae cyanobacterium Prado104]